MSKEEDELTYGETIKQPFPKLEDIEWVMIEAPEWYENIEVNGYLLGEKYVNITIGITHFFRQYHENSKDFKVTWQLKQTDPHDEIKAQYEEALKKYDVVQIAGGGITYVKNKPISEFGDSIKEKYTYLFKCYNIDWNKLLSWSYANGEFVECVDGYLIGYIPKREEVKVSMSKLILTHNYYFSNGIITDNDCRLAEGVEIKDEWLKEVK